MSPKAFRIALPAAVAAFFLVACESPGGKVSVMTSSTVALQPGSTYAWSPQGDAGGGDPRVDNSIIRERIQTAVETSLAAKGFRRSPDPNSAQWLVRYHIGLQDRTDTRIDTMGARPGGVACGRRGCVGGYGWGMYGAPMDVDVRNINYTEGTMMLDLVDRASGQLAWRATSQKRLDNNAADQASVNAVVADMVKSLPGPAAG